MEARPDSEVTEKLQQRLHLALAEALSCAPHSPRCQQSLQLAWEALVSGYTEPHRAYHTLSHLQAMLRCLDTAAAWQQQHAAPGDGKTPPPPPGSAHAAAPPHGAGPVPPSVVLAVFFHDLVYDPRAGDNEQASAELAREMLTQAGAAQQVVEDVVTLVLATKDHQLPASFLPGPGEPPADFSLSTASPQPQPAPGPGAAPGPSAVPGASLSRAACELFLDADLSVLAAPSQQYREYSQGIRYEYRHFPDQAYRSGRTAVLEKMLARPALYFSPWAHEQGMEAAARANIGGELEELRAGAELGA